MPPGARGHLLFLCLSIHDDGDVAFDEREGKEGDGTGSGTARGCLPRGAAEEGSLRCEQADAGGNSWGLVIGPALEITGE